jgi:dTDP-4-amino-4,6-dideoxygalactose transaminase
MAANVLSLPIYPELTDSEVERIVEKVNKPLNSNVKLMRSTNVKLLD